MRRTLLLILAAGSAATGIGCFKHIAGKCDCTYNPADAVLPAPSNPYYPGATYSGPVSPAEDPNKKAPAPKPAETSDSPMALPLVTPY